MDHDLLRNIMEIAKNHDSFFDKFDYVDDFVPDGVRVSWSDGIEGCEGRTSEDRRRNLIILRGIDEHLYMTDGITLWKDGKIYTGYEVYEVAD